MSKSKNDEYRPNYDAYKDLADLYSSGELLEIEYRDPIYRGVGFYRGYLLNIDMENGQLLINEETVGITIVNFEDIVSIQA